MAIFPKLVTGAIAQYPATRMLEHRTRVIRYIDGTEQRVSRTKEAIRRWVVNLDQLTEREAADVLSFFSEVRGRAEQFDFEDPWSGVIFSHCRFEQDEVRIEFTDGSASRTTLTIRSGD